MLLAWIATRLLLLGVFGGLERFVVGDVTYYWRKIAALSGVGLSGTLDEYPTPVVWLLWLPYGLSAGHHAGYVVAFVALMLLLDGAFTWAIWRADRSAHAALDFWLGFVLLIGPLSYLRFDILPAVLAGGALLAARRRPWVAGALTGLGAAIKLWPALLIPALLTHRAGRRSAGWSFVGIGFGLALLSLVTGGWSRLVSPLTWQSGRGLQIESIWATPLMLARAVRPTSWVVDMSRFQAYEVFGSGVSAWLTISDLATLLGLLVLLALWVRAFRRQETAVVSVGLVILATVAIMTVTNKTLSPQYLLWLGGPTAALLLLVRTSPAPERSVIRSLGWQLLGLALLTQLVYPLLYDGLLGRQGYVMLVLSTVVTALRNLALLVFTIETVRRAWRALAPPPLP